MTETTILDKVRKLLRLAENAGATPAEAALAAAKAQQLIDEHKLSATLLAMETSTPDPEPIINFQTKGAPLEDAIVDRGGRWQQRWRVALASTIAKANGCRIYTVSGDIALVGRPSDADTVRYLYTYLRGEVERLTTRHGAGCGQTWKNNFRYGVVDTIAKKMHAQRTKWEADLRAAANGTALVKINTALATIERRGVDIDRWIESPASGLKLRTVSTRHTHNPSARAAGRKAGESINVSGSGRRLTGSRGYLGN